MRFRAFVFASVLCCGLVAAGDRVQLKDGKVVTGKIVSETDADLKIETASGPILLSKRIVDEIERDVIDDATGAERHGPKATPALLEWIDVCIGKLSSADEGVRTTAMMALRAAGPAAVPALEKAVTNSNAEVSRTAQRLIEAAQRGPRGARAGARPSRVDPPMVTALRGVELTPEQRPQINALMGEYRDQQVAITEALRIGEIERDAAESRMGELERTLDTRLAQVLTEAQMQEYHAANERQRTATKPGR